MLAQVLLQGFVWHTAQAVARLTFTDAAFSLPAPAFELAELVLVAPGLLPPAPLPLRLVAVDRSDAALLVLRGTLEGGGTTSPSLLLMLANDSGPGTSKKKITNSLTQFDDNTAALLIVSLGPRSFGLGPDRLGWGRTVGQRDLSSRAF